MDGTSTKMTWLLASDYELHVEPAPGVFEQTKIFRIIFEKDSQDTKNILYLKKLADAKVSMILEGIKSTYNRVRNLTKNLNSNFLIIFLLFSALFHYLYIISWLS